ncbi:MAG: hypothetical protein ABEJ70_07570 [Halobacteriaceae archaeon]
METRTGVGFAATRAIQVVLAGTLVAAHAVSTSGYVYPHYVLLIVGHPWLCRRVGIRLRPWQVAYVSVALFLHPMGGLFGLYASIWWFDHLTHAMSATLVAAIGYVAVRGLWSAGRESLGPTWRARLFAFAFVMLAGVAWELIEELTPLLTVYGPNDTLWDYVFDGVGGLLVVIAGERALANAIDGFRAWVRTAR